MLLSKPTGAVRACDSCRRRKVKCDASEVCSNCRLSQLPCRYTSVPQKRGPKTSRARRVSEASQPSLAGAEVPLLQSPDPADQRLSWPSPAASTGQPASTEETTVPLQTVIAAVPALPFAGVDPFPTASSAQALRDGLLGFIGSALPSVPALEAVNRCIDLYIQYTFPTAPMVHEGNLRAGASRFFSDPCHAELFVAPSQQEELAHMRLFALLTGLCASVSSVMPSTLLPYREALARPCLSASRDMLKAIEDFDVQHPNSTSIVVRILHATALQHITGRTPLSHHVLGQANLLIRSMRLYSEEALKSHDALEAQLLRHIFWQMYAADKAAACLGSRPPLLHELLFDQEPSLERSEESFVPLLDATRPGRDTTFEERLLVGFRLLPRLWSSAASLLFDIKALARDSSQDAGKARLMQAYMDFLGIMDHLPGWLRGPNVIISGEDGEAAQFQKTAFWVQRGTVLVIFQCLRLVILQQCIDSKAWEIMGLSDHSLTLSMTKISMVHDFVQTLDDIPFLYIQIKGEPTVERIRRVGSMLLEMIDTVTNDAIKARAKHHFTWLLNLLAKLDPQSSNVLADVTELRDARWGPPSASYSP